MDFKEISLGEALEARINGLAREVWASSAEKSELTDSIESYWDVVAPGYEGDESLLIHLQRLVDQVDGIPALRADNARLRAALEPFAAGAVINSIERYDYSIMKDRIVDWHGPSDFKAARAAFLATIPAAIHCGDATGAFDPSLCQFDPCKCEVAEAAQLEGLKRLAKVGNCPTCDSPRPELHPAMQFEGEVQPCRNAWHSPVNTDIKRKP